MYDFDTFMLYNIDKLIVIFNLLLRERSVEMLLNELLEKRDQIHEIILRNKGKQVRVFGSVVNGDATEKSDVDLLVTFQDDASLFDLVEIKIEIEALLNIKVDVLSEKGLKNNEISNNIRRSALLI